MNLPNLKGSWLRHLENVLHNACMTFPPTPSFHNASPLPFSTISSTSLLNSCRTSHGNIWPLPSNTFHPTPRPPLSPKPSLSILACVNDIIPSTVPCTTMILLLPTLSAISFNCMSDLWCQPAALLHPVIISHTGRWTLDAGHWIQDPNCAFTKKAYTNTGQ